MTFSARPAVALAAGTVAFPAGAAMSFTAGGANTLALVVVLQALIRNRLMADVVALSDGTVSVVLVMTDRTELFAGGSAVAPRAIVVFIAVAREREKKPSKDERNAHVPANFCHVPPSPRRPGSSVRLCREVRRMRQLNAPLQLTLHQRAHHAALPALQLPA
jgi:hypothetical protein